MNEINSDAYGAKNIHGGWLTVNRACNLRCEWCYAADTNFDPCRNMDFEMATKLVDLFADAKARSIVLIGGEPTIYPRLIELGELIRMKGMTPALITNGVRLADADYCKQLRDAGITNITISIKGSSQEQYQQLTKTSGFTKMLLGVQNLRSINIDPSFEITIVKDYLPNLEDMFTALADLGVSCLTIDLGSPVVARDEVGAPNIPNPLELRDAVHRIYRHADRSKLDYVIYMTIPFCLLDQEILEELKKEDRLLSSCHIPHGNAIIFDEKGYVLPCNHMASQPLGQYGVDFRTAQEFQKFWNTHQLIEFRKTCSCYPAEPCQLCQYWGECGGGCMIKWMYWDPSQYISTQKFLQRKEVNAR